METKYYRVPEAAKILHPSLPDSTPKQIENYLYLRAGKSVNAKIEKHPITGRRDIWISEQEVERLKKEFMNNKI